MSELWRTLDEHLPAFSPAPSAYGQVEQRVRQRRQRRRRVVVAAAGAVATLAVGVAVLVSLPTDRSLAARVTIPIGGTPLGSVSASGVVWVLTCDQQCSGTAGGSTGRLVAVDARSATVISSTPITDPSAVAVGDDSVWLTHFWRGTVTRVDPDTGRSIATIQLRLPKPVGAGDSRFLPGPLAVGKGGVWVATARGYVARINPATNRVERLIRVADGTSGPLVTGPRSVWGADSLRGVLRINARTNHPSTITVSSGTRRLAIADVALADGAIWASGTWAQRSTDQTGHTTYRLTTQNAIASINPHTGQIVGEIALPKGPTALLQSSGSLWIGGLWFAPRGTLTIYRFDPSKARITRRYIVKTKGSFVAVQGGAIWITTPQGELVRIRLI
jgi:streptogramin lyase